MPILNIAGYKFISLSGLDTLRGVLLEKARALKGTILLSKEGINLSLAGEVPAVRAFTDFLTSDPRFHDMTFRESYSDNMPFKRFKIKLKKEIITMKQPDIHPETYRGPSVSPQLLKQWLDEKRDIIILDTRNDYEIRFGTFCNAVNLKMNDFSEFPESAKQLAKDKPIVMFCTGGIRCEKASLHMLNTGFQEVYQLEGGILNYFSAVGGTHYQGDCFVFDERVALNPELQKSGSVQCTVCQGPVSIHDQTSPTYVPDVSCPGCVN